MSSRLIRCDALGVAILALTPLLASAQQPPGLSVNQVADGSYLFRTYCAACHGPSARGDGPLAASLRRKPPDLTNISRRHNKTFPGPLVFQIIDGREKISGHGGPDMPVWGDAFQRSLEGGGDQAVRARIEALVAFIESIQTRETP